jgi:UDP-N-acetylglucosamine--N-acetylmuramyl-(pentapeptide) pyrophosphoryl-undecaprenol N-acetylglucosamine transferase
VTSAAVDRHPLGSERAFRVIVTGGGTGGHVFPALTVVRALRAVLAESGTVLEALWVGKADSLEERVAAGDGIPFTTVATGKIRRSSNPLKLMSAANLTDMGRVPLGMAQARTVISGFAPDVVLATGGYVAVPVGVAAGACRRPLVVHEQTVRLGLANRVLARVATRVAVSSESTLALLPRRTRDTAVVTGNPVRTEIFGGQARRAVDALDLRGFDELLPTVYVTGGAQGSLQINTVVRDVLPWLLTCANVVHQCGRGSLSELREYAAALPAGLAGRYRVTDFVAAELPDVLALADVVVSRSGAGTIAELTALGKAAVFVPLASSAGGEQRHNAVHLVESGAALALLGEVSAGTLRSTLAPLLADPALRRRLAERARSLGRPDAAQRLAGVVLDAAGYRASV